MRSPLSVKAIVQKPASLILLAACLLSFILGSASLLRGVYNLIQFVEPVDLPQFYYAPYLVRFAPGVSFYDPAVIQEYSRRLDIPYQVSNYPPFTALLFYPFSFFSYSTIKIFWLGFNLLLLALTILFLVRQIPRGRSAAKWFLVAYILLMPATIETLLLGQINFLLGVILLLALELAAKRTTRWSLAAAFFLALAGSIKLWPILLAGIFLIRRRFTIAFGSVLLFILMTLTGIWLVGGDVAADYFTRRMPSSGIQSLSQVDPINQSVWGVSSRLFMGGVLHRARISTENLEVISLNPLISSDVLYWVFIACFAFVLFAILAYIMFFTAGEGHVHERYIYWFSLLFILTMLPFSWQHYLFYLVFPLAALLSGQEVPGWKEATAGILTLLFAVLQRFYAWYPVSPLLYNFGFIAWILMLAVLFLAADSEKPLLTRIGQVPTKVRQGN